MVTDAEITGTVDWLRTWGRIRRLGINLESPTLPRSRKFRQAVEREAEQDPHVRRALDEIVQAEHAKPAIIRRHVRPSEVRIF